MLTIGRCVFGLALIVGLGGCKTDSGETFAEAIATDPGRYMLYECRALDNELVTLKQREIKLDRLMKRSSAGRGGAFVNLIAYQAEYSQTQGYQKLVFREKRTKNCYAKSK
jgi:hypothetical protein